jgi:amino acid transporter
VIASVDYALANYVVDFINQFSANADNPIITPKAGPIFVVYLLVLAAHGLLNTFGVGLVRLLGDISVWWHVAGVAVIFVVLFAAPDHRNNMSFLFEYQNNSGWSGGISTIYVCFLGFLLALRCLGARQRGDGRGAHRGAEGHRPFDLDLGGRRAGAQRRLPRSSVASPVSPRPAG